MLLSLVIPVYNEQDVLPALLDSLRRNLAEIHSDYEIVFVNDGSTDRTKVLLESFCAGDRRIKALSFCRNFGHQVAITAGLDFAAGDAVVIMDADLQDPPEILAEMVEAYRQGYDVVSAQRIARKKDSWFKRSTASMFYWIMRHMVDERLPSQVGDFRLFSRNAVAAIRRFREQHRFMRGMVAWLGLKETIVPFERQGRAAGESKYSTWKMMRFAWTAVSSFSGMPLRLALSFGLLLAAAGAACVGYIAYLALGHQAIPDWIRLAALETILSAAILIALGVVGDYIARIYEELKGRPLYVLSEAANIDVSLRTVERAVVLGEHPVREEQWSIARR